MGWAVGWDYDIYRWRGYGVPSVCEYPSCDAKIDRGLGYACRGLVDGELGDGLYDGCGRFFCGEHGGDSICERCEAGEEAFPLKPDTAEWLRHILTDETWQKWRDENPGHVALAQRELEAA